MTNADLLPRPVRPGEAQPNPQVENLVEKFQRYCDENPGAEECRIDDN